MQGMRKPLLLKKKKKKKKRNSKMEVATPCLLPGPGKTILARFAIYDRVCVL
jgi:hypothetical protein